eukprot:TRINITY_DN6549_c0_g1_i2.p1 TRINITY_DN6549_c0_g1~~TRINITY_DN6549_c0_g1_i2.p1  ORF type:complete len:121 (-),score=20.89 TRINITY_DN6549_c0_g1_i2:140-502(-)
MSFGSDAVIEFHHRPRTFDHQITRTEVYIQDTTDESERTRMSEKGISPAGGSHVKMLLESGSLLHVSEEAFTDWTHGIPKRDKEILGEDILNLELTKSKPGDEIVRSSRVSIVVWPLDEK